MIMELEENQLKALVAATALQSLIEKGIMPDAAAITVVNECLKAAFSLVK